MNRARLFFNASKTRVDIAILACERRNQGLKLVNMVPWNKTPPHRWAARRGTVARWIFLLRTKAPLAGRCVGCGEVLASRDLNLADRQPVEKTRNQVVNFHRF
jgi:hypothetical protein